ncbi:Cytochrome P450 CYP2 subfamily [Handroanthus impetiginosus]|uniref:Cytochrome P450 CYP2 subfamily n=1 Tax=Handroanthus impetiginosus TaxID=429701 RepID=A0A2G9HGN9_9LAMI|nr:Cytochrome P450 CYP2 subfamily [Handroanthus impetiginosus]
MLQKLRARSKLTKPTLNLPPRPRKLPFIGNLHNLSRFDPPHHTFTELAKKHGPLMHLQLGEVDTIIVSSPEIAKHILKTHDITTDKICTLELLSTKRVQSFLPIREQEVLDLCKWIARHEGSPINVAEKVSLRNYDIMVRAALGKKTNEQATFVAIVKEAVEFIVISGLKRKIEELHVKSDRIIGNIIEDRKRVNAAKIDEGKKQEEDLLDVLLKIQEAGSLELPFTMDNIKSVLGFSSLSLIHFDGIETSTTVVDWAMAEMVKNPRVLTKAQNEVRDLFDSKQHRVDESCLDELTYLKLVIKETLRMHPPAPLLLPRETRENCEINGYNIPAKTRVLVNVWAIGRSPKYWENPERLEPERFLHKSVDYKGNMFEYIPFGAGRRICPGISFGLANVEMPLAMFLYHFDWILHHGMKPEEMEMKESCGVAARRESSLYVIPVPVVRQPLPVSFEG